MEESARLDKLENAIRKTQDSMLLMGKDMHQINQSVSSVANSMEALVKVQQDVRIMEERNETRHQQLREADTLLHKRVDKIEGNQSRVAWTIITIVIVAVMGIIIKGQA